jgi:hypothetical protein
MNRQIIQIIVMLLVLVGLGIIAYLIWGVQRTGNLAIVSNPPGARVLLNLESTTYLTDTTITNLPEGKYSVTLEMKGYVAEPFVQVVDIQRNKLSAVSFDLKSAPLMAQQSQEPQTTTEAQKQRPAYQPSFPVPPPRTTKSVTEKSSETTVTHEASPVPAPKTTTPTPSSTSGEYSSLEIASNIFGADIYMDGNPTGQQTNATLMVPVGFHRITVSKENYKVNPEEITVEAKPGSTGQFVLFELVQDLSSLPYRLKISTEPVAGGITIDNIYRGRGVVNMEVDPGEYLVAFEPVDGYQTPSSRKATLTGDQRTATIVGTYERSLEFTMVFDSLGTIRSFGDITVDRGYFLPNEGAVVDSMWGPAIKLVKSLNSYCWELGWGIATRNPTGQDFLRFRFTIPQGFTRKSPLMMNLYIFKSSKNYPLTVANRAEMDLIVNNTKVWTIHVPAHHIDQNNSNEYETLNLNPYYQEGENTIIIKPSDSNQCFLYCRGIVIR